MYWSVTYCSVTEKKKHYGLNVYVPSDSYVKTVNSKAMMLGGQAFKGD